MTTAAAHAPARIPTPRPKHSRTASLQSEPTVASKSASIEIGGGRRGTRVAAANPLSDKATAFLIRRVLCPQQPDKAIEDLLPPLTSRNDVDLQLYALIAIILREYVQNWYSKITPDETFVAEIVQIIAHITRALEQRLRKVDLEALLFDELPELLDRHINAYRVAHDPMAQPPVRTDPRDIYHSLCPLPALSPVPHPEEPESVAAQAENEAAYRQLLVYAVLAILLPTEDLENDCLTALVGQILSELIIGNAVANRLSEPWLIWELLILASKTAGRRDSAEDEEPSGQSGGASPAGHRIRSIQALFWTLLQWCFLVASFIRTAFAILVTSRSLPPRASHGAGLRKSVNSKHEMGQASKTPVVTFRCWSAVSNLAEVHVRMPWLCGALSMLQWFGMAGPGRIAGPDGRLDRLISHAIHRYVLDPARLPPLLRSMRGAMFPNNMPAAKPTLVAPASDADLHALRRRCARSLWALVPPGAVRALVGRLYYFGGRRGLLQGRGGRVGPGASLSWAAGNDKAEGSASQLKKTTGKHDRDRVAERVAERDPVQNRKRDQGQDQGRGRLKQQQKRETEKETATPIETALAQTSSSSAPTPTPEQASSSHLLVSRPPRPAPAPNTGSGDLSADPPPSLSSSANSARREDASGGGRGSAGDDGPQRFGEPSDQDKKGSADECEYEDDDEQQILDEISCRILDVFSDAYCNKHLVYSALELVLVRLLPELAEKGVLELWEERVSM